MSNKLGRLKVIMQKNNVNTGTVVFLHGSGDTGPGVLEWLQLLVGNFSFPHIKFLFPTAPLRPYTPINGELSRVWFDRYSITPDVPEHTETIESSGEEIKKIIQNEVDSGIPLNRIIIGGFSMGGALSLHTAYRFLPGLGGTFALSSFLNENSAVYKNLQGTTSSTPLFMCHGERDTMVPISWGKTTFEKLSELSVKGEFVPLKNTLHELKKNEIEKLFQWISKTIPEKH
ncbi:hypothetical protein ILUMI_03929 [Ignelater luminosus]|uniref:palmitoyl-protein hydrolase n=1 Tax=Ignelater luminosus TaxID=2038154 RepID=A0A8K0DDJ6_IGNLU|nr:hypothetical protein ILUMI_03929 [Ignelater luminosus]